MFKIKVFVVLTIALFAAHLFVAKAGNLTTHKMSDTIMTAAGSPENAEQLVKCSVKAYRRGLNDENSSSLTNIRSQANKNSAIVKAISTSDEVVFFITGSSGGWFEISKVETIGTDDDKAIFQGLGWVHSSQLDLSVAGSDTNLYAAPKKTNRVLRKLIVDASPSEPLACQGRWMKVKSGKQIGWLSPGGQCANPLTTCP
jgi:hypothetical protein